MERTMKSTDLLRIVETEDKRLCERLDYPDKTKRILTRTTKIMEEVGELSNEVMASLGLQRKEKLAEHTREKLEDEFADVIFATLLLAKTMDIDVIKALKGKAKKVDKYYEQILEK